MPVAEKIKNDLIVFYDAQSSQKTADIDAWLNNGSARIPQPPMYYYFEDRKIDMALDLACPKPRARILEIGCNLGQQTFCFQEMGFDITGIDISRNAIDKATLRAKHFGLSNIRFKVEDAETLREEKSESYDTVLSFSAFRYVPNLHNGLKNVHRVLRKGGAAAIDFPNALCPWFRLFKPMAFVKTHIHDHLFHRRDLVNLFLKAGFVNIETRVFLFTYKELPSALLPAMKIADTVLESIPGLNKLAAIIMVKGEKK